MILCVRENDFDILINQGFINKDLSSIQTLITYSHIRGSMKAIIERLDGAAKQKAFAGFVQPVVNAAKMIEDKHDDKISDPDQIPPEMMPVVESAEDRFMRECAEHEERRFNTLVSFGHWFWDSPAGGRNTLKCILRLKFVRRKNMNFCKTCNGRQSAMQLTDM